MSPTPFSQTKTRKNNQRMDAPRRAYKLTLEIQGDTLDAIVEALEFFQYQLHEETTSSVTGGVTWGGHHDLDVDKSITHESYFEQVAAYRAAKRAEKG